MYMYAMSIIKRAYYVGGAYKRFPTNYALLIKCTCTCVHVHVHVLYNYDTFLFKEPLSYNKVAFVCESSVDSISLLISFSL